MRQSAITQFLKCPYKYKLQYVDNLKTIPSDDPANALIIGTAIHYGAETESIENMLKNYYSNFNILTDLQINEAIKLEHLLPQVLNFIKQFDKVEHEVPFQVGSFHGTADLLVHNKDGTVDLYDYKYSNNIDDYMESPQLHIYKYFLELCGYKVNRMAFIFIPKTFIRQKKTEDLYQFRRRLTETLKDMKIQIKYLEYDQSKVTNSLITAVEMLETKEFKKNPTKLCDWCEYKKYCFEGVDYMILPKNVRRERKIDTNPDLWIYADSYVGKSTFIDQYEDLLFLNTDGNTDNTTSPVVRIMDKVWYEGRIQKKKFAWEFFIEAIEELEKKDNDFKRVCIDLVEDLYEHCRLFTYDKLDIEHEQDAGFGKGWDMVRTEYLSAIKRLKNLGYQIIYISKEVVKEINLKNGAKLTTINPNINDKVANVLAGTVDLTVRAYMKDEDRFLQLEKKENVFGGGRFNFKVNKIPLDMKEFTKALEEAQEGVKTYSKMAATEEENAEQNVNPSNDIKDEKPTRRRPKAKKEDTTPVEGTNPNEEESKDAIPEEEVDKPKEESTKEVKDDKPVEEPKQEDKKPTRRRRRRKADEE